MKGHGLGGWVISLLILGGCVAGLQDKPVQEEIQKQEELSTRVGGPKAPEQGRPSELEGRLNQAVQEEAARGRASVARGDGELNIYLSDELIFSRENLVQMTPEGEKTLQRIGSILREAPTVPIELEAAAAFKPYGKSEETTTQLNQQLHLQLIKLAEHLEQKLGLPPERVRLQGEVAGEKAKPEDLRIRIVLIPTVE
ncbi:MAG: hypothetical protein HYY20_11880 [Candidatus Tectomicrobia bacterium]|uniref:Lipoprotein n=1 Tax=Tectimicrobiota bacterium TaxID=2528274 RepID=A0A932CQJ1_UNCTE|nr:hypothetical protein [Candidatus Tectomicrobia bacterium]